MIKIYPFNELGKGNYGWLNANYHFSFANYYNHKKIQLGSLRVLNDDYINPHKGFDTHPHSNMEIITYVISGELTHQDSMGNKNTLGRHGVQYMSAGTGVLHSEFNHSSEPLHLYQMWILPNEKDQEPIYGDMDISSLLVSDKFTRIVSSMNGDAPIKIRQDVSVSVGEFSSGNELDIDLEGYKYSYLVLIDGDASVEGKQIKKGDAISASKEYKITVNEDSHIYLIRVNDR